jgi:FlaA1/EpsC-like NDP-sugar epimerase
MEVNISEAVTNNVLGTRNLVELSERHAVQRFVMISSDKAVNPTSVMGVSKRIAELIVQDAAKRVGKTFVVVRFGNVLGSSGSVVPVFKRQIEMGGPITVTHPEVKRYFMTIPEAVQLVLQAATMGTGGETFVLDMGEQIPVVELARDMIRLNGLEEGRDIDIVFTGLRPGEKMFEELFYKEDRIERTSHDKIMVSYGRMDHDVPVSMGDGTVSIHQHIVSGIPGYEDSLAMDVTTIIEAAHQGSENIVSRLFSKLVPQFRTPDSAADADEAIARMSGQSASLNIKS